MRWTRWVSGVWTAVLVGAGIWWLGATAGTTDAVRYVVLLRFQLASGLVLLLAPLVVELAPAALGSLVRCRLWGVRFGTAGAVLLGTIVARTAQVALLHGHARYGVADLGLERSWAGEELGTIVFALALALPLAAALVAGREASVDAAGEPRPAEPWHDRIVAAGTGAIAIAVVPLASFVFEQIAMLPAHTLAGVVPAPVLALLGDGYVEGGQLHRDHLEALALFVVFAAIYAAGYRLLSPARGGALRERVPALWYLLTMLQVACWGFAGAAFFLDFYRVPVALLAAAWVALVVVLVRRDHVYPVLERDARPAAGLPFDAGVEAWLERHRESKPIAVVVAASGGGIVASCWTDHVLTELDRIDGFTASVRFASAVSGSSVGLVPYLEALRRGNGALAPGDVARVRKAASASSLEATAWGLAYPDLLRLVLPPLVPRRRDRGWAIEQAWREHLHGTEPTLRAWAADVERGVLPAVVFNATAVETGERVLFGPTRVAAAARDPERMARHVFDLFPGCDVSAVTAARLSATFPFVSPVARGERADGGTDDADGLHLADGGYFDNFGVVSAVEWIEALLERWGERLGGVLLVQIRASCRPGELPRERPGLLARLAQHVLAPLVALMKVRGSTQIARGDVEVDQQRAHWCGRYGEGFYETVAFHFCGEGPLSWQIGSEALAGIAAQWSSEENEQARATVAAVLAAARSSADARAG